MVNCVEMSFCNKCGEYVHPERAEFLRSDADELELICPDCRHFFSAAD